MLVVYVSSCFLFNSLTYGLKQMPLIQVTSGGQRSLLKKKLQVCESQQSCLFVGDRILIFHHNLQINSLKILQCDFLDFFSYSVSHSWGIPMMEITGLSRLFKWENLHNWWLTKYFFAPLYLSLVLWLKLHVSFPQHLSACFNFSISVSPLSPEIILEPRVGKTCFWINSLIKRDA